MNSRSIQKIHRIHQPEVVPAPVNLAEITYASAELSAFRDKLRAVLAKEAMSNVAALAEAEAFYNQIAPGGREAYQYILKAYTYKSVIELIGGEL